MPRLNLSVLSDPNHVKQMSKRENDLMERINKLKYDESAMNRPLAANAEMQQTIRGGAPQFIGQIQRQISTISRNVS